MRSTLAFGAVVLTASLAWAGVDAHAGVASAGVASAVGAPGAVAVALTGVAGSYGLGPGALFGSYAWDSGTAEAGALASQRLGAGFFAHAAVSAALSGRAGWSVGPRGLLAVSGAWGDRWVVRPSLSSSLAWVAGPGAETAWLAPVEASVELAVRTGPVVPYVRLAGGIDLLSARRSVARGEASVGLALMLP